MSLRAVIGRLMGSGPLYVRLRRKSLHLRDVGSGEELEDLPVVAISKVKPCSILAVGGSAEEIAARQRVPFELVNGFDHPRLLISDFLVAEKTLQHFIVKLLKPKIFKPAPVVVLHPLEPVQGGVSQLEVRALQELARGAGAREAYVWAGRELQDHELRSRAFTSGEGLLSDESRWQ